MKCLYFKNSENYQGDSEFMGKTLKRDRKAQNMIQCMVVSLAVKRYRAFSYCEENPVHYTISASRAFPSAEPYMKCMFALSYISKTSIWFTIHGKNDDAACEKQAL